MRISSIYQYAEILSFLYSLCKVGALRHSYMIWIVPYLFIVVYVDTISLYFPITIHGSNHWQYNGYIGIEYFFFTMIFYRNLSNRLNRGILTWGSMMFVGFYAVNLALFQGPYNFNNWTFLVICFLIILYSCLTLREMIWQNDEQPVLTNFLFWICAACLVFFVGFSVIFSVYFFYRDSPAAYREHEELYSAISDVVNLVHYGCLSVALYIFLKRKG